MDLGSRSTGPPLCSGAHILKDGGGWDPTTGHPGPVSGIRIGKAEMERIRTKPAQGLGRGRVGSWLAGNSIYKGPEARLNWKIRKEPRWKS